MTQEKIEQSVVDFILANGRKPSFALMDKKSYARFQESFKIIGLDIKTIETSSSITFYSVTDCEVEILSIENKEDFFQVV